MATLMGKPTTFGKDLYNNNLLETVNKFVLLGADESVDNTLLGLIDQDDLTYSDVSDYIVLEDKLLTAYVDSENQVVFLCSLPYETDLKKFVYSIALVNEDDDGNKELVDWANFTPFFQRSQVGGTFKYISTASGTGGTIIFRNYDYITKEELEDLGLNSDEIENLTSTVSELSDKIDGFDSSITDLHSNVNDLSSNVDSLTSNLDALGNDVSDLTSKVDELETSVTNLNSDVSDLTSSVDSLTTDLNTVGSNVSDLSDKVNGIETSVDDLNSNVTDLTSSVDSLTTDLNTIGSNVSDLSDKVDGIETSVNDITSSVDSLTTDLNTVGSNVSDLSDKVDDLENTVSDLNSDVTDLTSSVDSLTTDLNSVADTVSNNTSLLNETKDRVDTNEENISTNATNIKTNSDNISSLDETLHNTIQRVDDNEENITSLTTKTDDINNSLTSLSETVTNNETAIDDLSSRVSTNESNISANKNQININASNITNHNLRLYQLEAWKPEVFKGLKRYVYLDAVNGDDSTAEVGNSDKPFKTFDSAFDASYFYGGLIVMFFAYADGEIYYFSTREVTNCMLVAYPWNFNGSDKPILANVAYKYNDDYSTMSQFRVRDQGTLHFQNFTFQVADPVEDTVFLENAYSTTPFMLDGTANMYLDKCDVDVKNNCDVVMHTGLFGMGNAWFNACHLNLDTRFLVNNRWYGPIALKIDWVSYVDTDDDDWAGHMVRNILRDEDTGIPLNVVSDEKL